jgi:hypothetical protein
MVGVQARAHHNPGGKMDFGARPALDGRNAPVPDATLRMAWFERSSTERSSASDPTVMEPNTLLDRFREADGLVYNDEGDYEL